jgi:hypothetical protein
VTPENSQTNSEQQIQSNTWAAPVWPSMMAVDAIMPVLTTMMPYALLFIINPKQQSRAHTHTLSLSSLQSAHPHKIFPPLLSCHLGNWESSLLNPHPLGVLKQCTCAVTRWRVPKLLQYWRILVRDTFTWSFSLVPPHHSPSPKF